MIRKGGTKLHDGSWAFAINASLTGIVGYEPHKTQRGIWVPILAECKYRKTITIPASSCCAAYAANGCTKANADGVKVLYNACLACE